MTGKNNKKMDSLDLEREVLTIWQRALNNDKLSVDDDFFEFGGDSLLATDVLLEIEELTGKLLSPTIIFETGTVRELVKIILTQDHEELLCY